MNKLKMEFIFVLFIFLLASSSVNGAPCNRRLCVHKSKAAYFPLSKPLITSGACGYGSMAKGFNKGYIASGISSLLEEKGVNVCGSCIHVTCKNETLCRGRGTNVVLTDSIHRQTRLRNVGTDLILSDRAFISMAAKGKARELLALRSYVEVEYERIPCEYKNQNVSIRVDESNNKRDRFVLTLLYQGGQTGIFSISVMYADTNSSSVELGMTHKYGAVWEIRRILEGIRRVPTGGRLSFKLLVYKGHDLHAYQSSSRHVPANWKIGEIYDLGFQLNGIIDVRSGCNCTG
ncbi:hypothetical protein C5167_024814 [Papaver somniferum]|uniref:Expansin-like EG45 domain-containing protein n=1 Tax=Papaver somniferum TaxID=3469 RepID=A0A4Y7JPP1_PAPSO|nr:expansin-like A1 [Papaver somniferum]RZC63064.1 hypothetical protein C5167_024814 [Papaver somniferum]